MPETQVQSLGLEDPLEKEMATHSSALAWEIMDRGAWQTTVHGVAKEVDMTLQLSNSSLKFHTHFSSPSGCSSLYFKSETESLFQHGLCFPFPFSRRAHT